MNLIRVYGIVLRHYFQSLRQLERLFDAFLLPLVSLLVFGFMANYISQLQSPNLVSFLIGGIILWMIFERVGSDISINFMYDVWDHNMINVLATPLTFLEFIVGLIIIGVFKILVSFLSMWFIATFFYGFNLFSLGFELALIWANILFFAISFGVFSIALVMRFGNSVGPLTWILPFSLQPLSAAFYPITVLPGFLQVVAYALPLSHAFEGMRSILQTGYFNYQSFLIGLILNLFYFVCVMLFFTCIVKSVRKSGRLVKIN